MDRQGQNRERQTFSAILGDHLALVVLAVLVVLALQMAAPARAQAPSPEYWNGELLLGSNQGAVQPALRLRTDYHIVTERGVRRVWLRQTFRNDSPQWQRGLYLFELPEASRVRVLRMTLDGEEVPGVAPGRGILRRPAARAGIGKAAHGARALALQGVVFQEVLGIAPAGALVVELVYEQAIGAEAAARTVALPLPSFRLLTTL